MEGWGEDVRARVENAQTDRIELEVSHQMVGIDNRVIICGVAATSLLAAVIGALTLSPIQPFSTPGSDKLHHFIAFAALAFPLAVVRPRLVQWIILCTVAYGAVIEIIQPYVGRQAEWADLYADFGGSAVGALIGAALGMWWLKVSPQ